MNTQQLGDTPQHRPLVVGGAALVIVAVAVFLAAQSSASSKLTWTEYEACIQHANYSDCQEIRPTVPSDGATATTLPPETTTTTEPPEGLTDQQLIVADEVWDTYSAAMEQQEALAAQSGSASTEFVELAQRYDEVGETVNRAFDALGDTELSAPMSALLEGLSVWASSLRSLADAMDMPDGPEKEAAWQGLDMFLPMDLDRLSDAASWYQQTLRELVPAASN